MILKRTFRFFIFFISLFSFERSSLSEVELESNGHLKLKSSLIEFNTGSQQSQIGPDSGGIQDYNFRLNLKAKLNDISIHAELESNGIGGSSKKAISSFLLGRPLLENDRHRILDLSTTEGDDDFQRVNRFDRGYIQYSKDNLNISVGRQAVTFGQGIVFPVLDIFIPFSPLQYDREYKIGEDLTKFNYDFGHGLSFQSILIGRRDESENISAKSGSFLAMTKYELESIDFQVLIGNHYDKFFSGISASYVLNDYIVRTDISLYESEFDGNKSDYLINIDRGITLLGYESYIFLEYYQNALGSRDSDYNIANTSIESRLRRGEVFSIGRNYLAPGFRVTLTERIQVSMVNILNIDDQSFAVRPLIVFEPNDSFRIRAGFSKSIGKANTEYGGFAQNGLSSLISPVDQLFIQGCYYF